MSPTPREAHERLVSTAELAHVLGVTPDAVRDLVSIGRITPYRLGPGPRATMRFRVSEVLDQLRDTTKAQPQVAPARTGATRSGRRRSQ